MELPHQITIHLWPPVDESDFEGLQKVGRDGPISL